MLTLPLEDRERFKIKWRKIDARWANLWLRFYRKRGKQEKKIFEVATVAV
jgi:hypothetical protein